MNSWSSTLDVEWSASRPGRFTPKGRAPGTQWIGGSVGGGEEKNSQPLQGLEPTDYTAQRYTTDPSGLPSWCGTWLSTGTTLPLLITLPVSIDVH